MYIINREKNVNRGCFGIWQLHQRATSRSIVKPPVKEINDIVNHRNYMLMYVIKIC